MLNIFYFRLSEDSGKSRKRKNQIKKNDLNLELND